MGLGSFPRRGDVFLVEVGAARGHEIQKSRPYVVVSPDELNARLEGVIIVPLTTGAYPYLFRVQSRFAGRRGHLVLDQMRSVDSSGLLKRLGKVSGSTLAVALRTLQEMFAA